MSINEFNYRLSKTSKYFDGHTNITFAFLNETKENLPLVDFNIDGLIINDFTVLKIDGIDTRQIIDDLDKMVTWEYSEKGKAKVMNSHINSLLQDYYKIFPPYRCTIDNNLEIKDTVIHTINIKEWRKEYQPSYNSRYHTRTIDFEYYFTDSIAVIYIITQ